MSVRTRVLVPSSLLALLLPSASFAAGGAAAPSERGSPDFRFAILGDRTGSATPGVYEAIVAEVASFAPDVILTVGDAIEGYTDDRAVLETRWDAYDSILAPLAAVAPPVRACAGNNDIGNDVQERVWMERQGHAANYSFDYDGVHFTFLDTGRWESSEEWLVAPGHREWLERDLSGSQRSRLTVVVLHKPFWYETLAEGKPDPLHEIFRGNGVDAVWSGHFHLHGSARYDGIDYTIVPSSGGAIDPDPEWGAFYGWVWGTVHGNALSWTVVGRDGVRQAGDIRVEDLKFRENLDRRIVLLDPVVIGETDAAAGRCILQVHNVAASGLPLRAAIAWEPASGWTLSPDRREIDVPPGGDARVAFAVQRTGSFYPLPKVRFEYPYRAGRTYHYERPLPALRVQTAGRLDGRPVIDGDPRERVWDHAGKAVAFGSEGGVESAAEPVCFRFGYDDDALYLAARCTQAELRSIRAAARERDGAVHQDDCVGFFLCPEEGEKSRILQVYVNPAGTVMDSEIVWREADASYEGQGMAWNGDLQAAAIRYDEGWSAEIRIPFETLGTATPRSGTSWRVNFRRKEPSRGANADWQVPIGYDPTRFGYLVFEEPAPTSLGRPISPAR
ncbi:MAG: metallophosphoesterase [Candidatus Eisenbacteria bacterium]|nr:metallophosphoesterase [Candidatus Eisenbacteria bacterium]